MSDDFNIADIARVLISRVKKDFDAVICISGDEGMGKSVLAIHLLIEICRQNNQKFSLDDNVIYNPDVQKVWDKILYTTDRYAPVLLDEAITLLYKMGFASAAQRTINKLYSVCRKENKITVLAIPNFFDLNTFFRNRRVMIWIEVIGRGRAVVFIRDWSPYNPDRWHTKESQKLIEKYTRRRTILRLGVDDKIQILRRLNNYIGDFYFDDLDKDTKREYKKRAAAIKYELKMDDDSTGLNKKYKLATEGVVTELYKTGQYTQQKIADIAKVNVSTVNRILKDSGVRKSDRE